MRPGAKQPVRAGAGYSAPMHTPRRRRSLRRWSLLCCIAASAAGPLGCAAGERESPELAPAAVDDRQAPDEARLQTMRRLRDRAELAPETRETLKRVVWQRSTNDMLRVEAIGLLLRDDEPDTRAMLALMLPTETSWPVIEHIATLSAQRGWTDMTPALVRSWSRSVLSPADEDRPERDALLALHPDTPLEEVVIGVFADDSLDGLFAEETRQDAWTLLRRLDPDGRRSVALLRTMPDDEQDAGEGDALIDDIRRAAVDLAAIPETSRQLDWVRDMRAPEHAAFWRDASNALQRLEGEQREGLELRHAAVARWAATHRSEWFDMSRDAMLSRVETILDGRPRHERTGGSGDAVGRLERLRTWRDRLVWADAASILLADMAARDPHVAHELFRQAEADLEDTSTEHGGVLDAVETDASADPAFDAIGFAPRPSQRMGDRRFIASVDMLKRGATALFHYHFHANDRSNGEYAGPSEGDLVYAREFGRACLVFTFIDKNTLGVDYYQPGGERVDLGEIQRP